MKPQLLKATLAVVITLISCQRPIPQVVTLSPLVYLPLVSNRLNDDRHGAGLVSGNCSILQNFPLGWFYNWGFEFDEGTSALCDSRYVDMWRANDQNLQTFYILGANEPDHSGPNGDNPTYAPEQYIALWHSIEQAHPNQVLISPVPSQLSYGWMWDFIIRYRDAYGVSPRLNYFAVHFYYASYQPYNAFETFIESVHSQAVAEGYSGEIWVTEFCMWSGTTEQQVQWMKDKITWMSQQDYIKKWAWFAVRDNTYVPSCSLINPQTGQLTPLGIQYASWPW